jgi:hypothetical protein
MTLGPFHAALACGALLTASCIAGSVPLPADQRGAASGATVDERPATAGDDSAANLHIQNATGLQLLVSPEHTSPVLHVVLPDRPTSDRSIEVLFPEHVTVIEKGQKAGRQLYLFRPGRGSDRTLWRRSGASLEYDRTLGEGLHLRARATLEDDGVRFRLEVTNGAQTAYDLVYAPLDPRLTSIFHDVRLERTYVHHADGFDLLASETPHRLTAALDRWLPARYLASFTWPIPSQRVERRDDGILYYNKSRAVDLPFIATVSSDGAWVVASVARTAGNVWSNPELTCQHVDSHTSLAPGQRAIIEVKLLVIRGSLKDALDRAIQQRGSLE